MRAVLLFVHIWARGQVFRQTDAKILLGSLILDQNVLENHVPWQVNSDVTPYNSEYLAKNTGPTVPQLL